MSPQPNTDDIKRELQATLAARREVGSGYDEQFIERLVQQLTAQIRRDVANAPKPKSQALSSDQRTGLAICSIIFLIPLIAIAGGMFQLAGVAIVCAAVFGINLMARL
ncbi:MAG TPA: hypothetical protein VGS80_02295 [Ktedonobacterales bacterium]|nr:hypothetical protein [Ktedonobacterales bacterium]